MRVYSTVWPTERAKTRGYKDGRPSKYRAFPPKTNLIDDEKVFDTEESLATFLIKNANWKTYFRQSNGKNGQHLAAVLP